jgi:hypothetical protein
MQSNIYPIKIQVAVKKIEPSTVYNSKLIIFNGRLNSSFNVTVHLTGAEFEN